MIADVRRLIYGLRPPAIDELGLVDSLRGLASREASPATTIDVEAPGTLPPLPAAVEVAAYRIVQEALTNVARHACAQSCTVRLSIAPDAVLLEIADDGQGIAERNIGVGLGTMHERAAELGGSCEDHVDSRSGHHRHGAAAPLCTGGRRVSDPIRILIADDHPLFRGGLRSLLESVADTEVVGEAASGREAVQLARSLAPDVVVMDINMPDLNGIEATRQIVQTTQNVHVLVMTMHEDDDAVFAALRAGARGYQLKGALQAETLRAIRAVANGEAILGPAIAARLQGYVTAQPAGDPRDAFPQLTEREVEVLRLIAERLSNAEIAAKLFLSQKTVRNYVSGILSKLQVADRAEARLIARAAGLGEPGA